MKFNYLFCNFELKDKFWYLTNECSTKKKIIGKLSSCEVKKLSGFTIVRVENEISAKKKFYPIDIIYRPVKNWPEFNVDLQPKCTQPIGGLLTMEIKLNIALQGSVITVQIFMLENINMIGTLKIAQDNLACTFGYF